MPLQIVQRHWRMVRWWGNLLGYENFDGVNWGVIYLNLN